MFITFLIVLVKALQKHGTICFIDHRVDQQRFLQQLVQCLLKQKSSGRCSQSLQHLGCQHAYLELVGTQNTPHRLGKIFLLGHPQSLHPARNLTQQES